MTNCVNSPALEALIALCMEATAISTPRTIMAMDLAEKARAEAAHRHPQGEGGERAWEKLRPFTHRHIKTGMSRYFVESKHGYFCETTCDSHAKLICAALNGNSRPAPRDAEYDSGGSYRKGVDPEVTCWHCHKTFLCDAMDATCRLCGAPYDQARCKEFNFVPTAPRGDGEVDRQERPDPIQPDGHSSWGGPI